MPRRPKAPSLRDDDHVAVLQELLDGEAWYHVLQVLETTVVKGRHRLLNGNDPQEMVIGAANLRYLRQFVDTIYQEAALDIPASVQKLFE